MSWHTCAHSRRKRRGSKEETLHQPPFSSAAPTNGSEAYKLTCRTKTILNRLVSAHGTLSSRPRLNVHNDDGIVSDAAACTESHIHAM